MPISEKDVFAALMQDPNHAYNPIEKVWAEAQQRARQFRNNEKALALAFDKSPALEKLFDFVQKAAPDDDFKHRLIENLEQYQNINERFYELLRLQGAWGQYSQFDPTQRIPSTGNRTVSAQVYNELMMANQPVLEDLLTFVQELEENDDLTFVEALQRPGRLTTDQLENIRDFIGEYVRDGGELKASLTVPLPHYETHEDIQRWNEEARIELGQPQPDPQPNGNEETNENNDTPPPTGNAGYHDYLGLTPTQRTLFHAQMDVPATLNDAERGQIPMQDMAENEFRARVDHFIEGLRLPNDADRTAYWGTYQPLPIPGGPAPTPFEEEDDENDNTNDEDDTNENDYILGDRNALANQIPRQLMEIHPHDVEEDEEAHRGSPLIPTLGVDETPFNPFDTNLNNDDNFNDAINKLVEEYLRLHESDGTNAHLGPTVGEQEAYFPSVEGRTPSNWQFDKAQFTDDQVKEYNKLNANKAALEEHLKILFAIRDAERGPDQSRILNGEGENRERYLRRVFNQDGSLKIPDFTDHLATGQRGEGMNFSRELDSSIPIPEGADAAYVRMEHIPKPGAYDWYQILNAVAGIGGGDTDIPAYIDEEGNPSFHLIPQEYLEGLGYAPKSTHLDAFLSSAHRALEAELGGDVVGTTPEGGEQRYWGNLDTDVIAKDVIERAMAQDPNAWTDFTTTGTQATPSHFVKAWEKWKLDYGPREGRENAIATDQLGHFMDWLGVWGDESNPNKNITMNIGGEDQSGSRFSLIPRLNAENPMWHTVEGDEDPPTNETNETDGTNENGGTNETDEDDPVILTEEERAWAADHEDFSGADLDDPAIISSIKAAYEEHVTEQTRLEQEEQQRQEAFNALPESLQTHLQAIHDADEENIDNHQNVAHRWSRMGQEAQEDMKEEVQMAVQAEKRKEDIDEIIATQKLLGDFPEEEEASFRRRLARMDSKKFDTEADKHQLLRRKVRQDERKKQEDEEKQKSSGQPTRTPEELQDLKNRFIEAYKNAFDGVEMTPDKIAALDAYSVGDYDKLDKEYQSALKIQHDNNVKEKRGHREAFANNIGGPNGIDPLPENADADDVMLHLRQIEMWKHSQLPYMTDKNAKDALNQLEVAAHQQAEALGFDAKDFIKQDMADAEDLDETYGTSAWFKKVGEGHIAEQQKTANYQRNLVQGGELRANRNYKPWLVIAYDEAGAGHFLDLRQQDPDTGNWGREIPREDLTFDSENAGFEYTGSGDVSALGNPEDTFWDKLDYANLKPKSKTDLEEVRTTEPPRVAHSSTTGREGESYAWYHPESGSWINPHRYFDARAELANSPQGSGMVLLGGANQYHGGNAEAGGTKDAQYGFQFLGQGMRPNSYYLDGQGNIAYMNTDDKHQNMNQPQSINSVVHDWHLTHMKDQVLNNQQQFLSGPGEHHDKVILNSQQVPLQNAVQVGDALHRRREQGKQFSRRMFDRLDSDELGFQSPTYYGQSGRMQVTPRTATEKVKQGIVGAAAYTESGMLTGLAKLALNVANVGTLGLLGLGWGKDQNNLRRHRAVYNKQHTIERQLQDHMVNVTDNGRIRQYISPGEESARKEDHKAIRAHLGGQRNWHQNQAASLRNMGDKDGADVHEQQRLGYQALDQELANLKIEEPEHWQRIDEVYNNHMPSAQGQRQMPQTGFGGANLADIFKPPEMGSSEQDTLDTNWD